MADTPWAIVSAFAGSALIGVLTFLGTRRTSQASEKNTDRTTQAAENTALLTTQTELKKAELIKETETMKMFRDELKEEKENRRLLEASLRGELRTVDESYKKLQRDFHELDLRFAKLEIEYLKSEAAVAELKEENAELKESLRVKDRRIDTLLETQIGMMEHIKRYASEPFTLPSDSDIIGGAIAPAVDYSQRRLLQQAHDNRPQSE
jgi:chromosome segregation ATPase